MNRFIRYLLIFGFMGLFTLIIFNSVIMPWYIRKAHSIPLINLKNKTISKAIDILESEGFKAIINDTVFTNAVLSGIVMDQFPKPYSRVKAGRTVRLSISHPERLVDVPNLIGQSKRNGELILQQVGLLLDTVYFEFHPDKKEGTIIWQSPRGGDVLRKGNGIHLSVSQGKPPNFFQVPNMYQLSKTEAEKELKKSGLLLGKIDYKQDTTLIPFTVLDQSILPGTVLEKSIPVNIVISVEDLQDIFNQVMEK